MEKSKKGQGLETGLEGWLVQFTRRMLRDVLTEKVTFEQHLKEVREQAVGLSARRAYH